MSQTFAIANLFSEAAELGCKRAQEINGAFTFSGSFSVAARIALQPITNGDAASQFLIAAKGADVAGGQCTEVT